jgi:hypothetical protein
MSPNSRSIVAFCALALLASVGQAARVELGDDQTATVVMTADGIPYDVPLLFDDEKGIWEVGYFDDFGNKVEEYTVTRAGEWECSIKGAIDPDPSHDFALSFTDTGTPTTFTFTATSPMVPPIGFPNTVNASIVGGLTDLTGNGVSVTPAPLPLVPADGDGIPELLMSQVGVPITSMGVDVGLPESGIGTYGPYAAGPTAGPGPGPWTILTTTLSFTLSGGGDTFATTFHSEIVPEPSSFVLAGIGALVALGVAIRRRRA